MREAVRGVPEEDLRFAELAIAQGLTTRERVEECLAQLQRLIRDGTLPVPKLGELLATRGYLSASQRKATTHRPVRPDSPLPPEAADPANVFGRYVRTMRLGSGGMGDVWKAWDTELGRWVALKFLKSDDAEELLRFEREAQTAAALSHPNIAAVYDVGERDGRHFIALQLIDGSPLSAVPRDDRRALVAMVRDAALAVEYAHEHGVVHRDLKPQNLMVERDTRRVFVMDFGLARHLRAASNLTASGMLIGTPAYMSPEQATGDGRAIDARSDVYSLGATLYDLLAGRTPFADANVIDLVLSVVHDDAPPLRKFAPAVDQDLEKVVMKCLEKERSRRYATAKELAEDLGRWLDGEPVRARKVSTLRRWARKARRHKGIAIPIAAVALVAIVVIAAQALAAGRREAALRQVAALWPTILGHKHKLRSLRSPPAKARADLAETLAGVDAYVAGWPREPQGHYLRARGRLFLGDLAGAAADASRAVELRAGFRPGWTLLGVIRLTEYRERLIGAPESREERAAAAAPLLAQATEAFSRGWKAGEEKAEAERWGLPWTSDDAALGAVAEAMRVAHAENDVGRAREGLAAFHAASRTEEAALHLSLWSPGEAERWLEEALRLAPGYDVALLERAVARIEKGEAAGAVDDCGLALELRPQWVQALLARARARRKAGQAKEALEDLDRALLLKPDFVEALCERAQARRAAGRLEDALTDAETAVRVSARSSMARHTRGVIHGVMDRPQEALRDFDEALKLNPDSVPAYTGRSAAKLQLRDFTGAVADLDQAIARKEDAALLVRRGEAKRAAGDPDGALVDFERAVTLKPDLGTAWLHIAAMRFSARDFAGALEAADRAVRLLPDAGEAWNTRGCAKAALSLHAEAITDFDRAVKLKPEFPDALANRGRSHHHLGSRDEAARDYEEALRRAPDTWPKRRQVQQWLDQLR